MKLFIIPSLTLFAVLCSPLWAQPPSRPVISHEAPASVVDGQPFRIVARVSSPDSIREVNLHLAQSAGSAPVELSLRSAGAGVYSVVVSPEQFAGLPSFRYYLDARSDTGAFSETDWVTVKVIGGSGNPVAIKSSDWKRPALIAAGAVVAVGAGVAIAGSGGGGGGDDSGDTGDGTDPADQIIVRTLSQNIDQKTLILPQVAISDVVNDLAGRSIRRVRVQINFDAVDEGPETYEVYYNGSVILTDVTAGNTSKQVDVVGASAAQVIIQVTNSIPVDDLYRYSWNATITYFLE
ncbi:hypothetical protein P3T73_05575 [Kiritimatiellota bacterium B12222]|nr:hypothetical protein P3T73_05575 [Kiritimatiellota bacterium B12222]